MENRQNDRIGAKNCRKIPQQSETIVEQFVRQVPGCHQEDAGGLSHVQERVGAIHPSTLAN